LPAAVLWPQRIDRETEWKVNTSSILSAARVLVAKLLRERYTEHRRGKIETRSNFEMGSSACARHFETGSSQSWTKIHENHEVRIMGGMLRRSPLAAMMHHGTECPRRRRPALRIQQGELRMQWETPTAVDIRFGFEITMYVAAR